MNEPDNFLSRWSRRKLEAEQEKESRPNEQNLSARPRDPPAHKASAGGAQSAEALAKAESGDPESHSETAEPTALDSRSPLRQSEALASRRRVRGNERGQDSDENKEPPFDITKLPSIESITTDTDITAFLQKGVPADLTRAALRRAWIADPNIRDFIEIAENQWDFATGSDLPGFGSLDVSTDDIRRMVAEVFGERPKLAAETPGEAPPDATAKAEPAATSVSQTETAEDAAGQVPKQEIAVADQGQPPAEGAPAEPAEVVVQRDEANIAMQQSTPEPEYKSVPTRRPHGRALPQ